MFGLSSSNILNCLTFRLNDSSQWAQMNLLLSSLWISLIPEVFTNKDDERDEDTEEENEKGALK